MTTLTVWKFDSADGAQKALDLVTKLTQQRLIELQDAAILSWPPAAKHPTTRQLVNMTGVRALDGAFWGMLLGWLFFNPLLGMAVGAAAGAISGHFANYGIGKNFVDAVRSKVTPGTSALFLLTGQVTWDKVAAAAKEAGVSGELIQSNLSNEEEAKLREGYGN
jgi:uncharacterized membrane protein